MTKIWQKNGQNLIPTYKNVQNLIPHTIEIIPYIKKYSHIQQNVIFETPIKSHFQEPHIQQMAFQEPLYN